MSGPAGESRQKYFPQFSVSPLFALWGVLPWLTGRGWPLLFLAAALLHEGGHLLALYLLGGKAETVRLRLSGAELRWRGRLSYGGEALLALAGPGANLLWALLCAALTRLRPAPGLYRFIGCHLTLALFNLLPALPLDGGRALCALLERRFPLHGAWAAELFGGAVGAALALLGLWTLYTGGNCTLLAAGGVILCRLTRHFSGKGLYTRRKS